MTRHEGRANPEREATEQGTGLANKGEWDKTRLFEMRA